MNRPQMVPSSVDAVLIKSRRIHVTRLWQLRAARAARGAPAGGSAGVAGAHKFTEGAYFLFPFRRVSRLRRPFFLRPIASPCRTG